MALGKLHSGSRGLTSAGKVVPESLKKLCWREPAWAAGSRPPVLELWLRSSSPALPARLRWLRPEPELGSPPTPALHPSSRLPPPLPPRPRSPARILPLHPPALNFGPGAATPGRWMRWRLCHCQLHNRKCSRASPFLPGESGACCSAASRDLVSGPTPSTLLVQGLTEQGLAGPALCGKPGWALASDHILVSSLAGTREHPEGSRKDASSAE